MLRDRSSGKRLIHFGWFSNRTNLDQKQLKTECSAWTKNQAASGVILAGGESERFSSDNGSVDRAFLDLDGEPLIFHVDKSFRQLFNKVIVIADTDDSLYKDLDIEMAPDMVSCKKKSLMMGLYSALSIKKEARVCIGACNIPFVHPQLLFGLAGKSPAKTLSWRCRIISSIFCRQCVRLSAFQCRKADRKWELQGFGYFPKVVSRSC